MEVSPASPGWARSPGTPNTRAQSRSSNGTTGTTGTTAPRNAAQPINTSSQSQRSASPPLKTPSTPSQSYRSRHGGCKPSMPPYSLGLKLSTDNSADTSSRLPQTPVSSFLLEKLRQERLAESEKLTSRTPVDMSASLDLGAAPSSPARVASPADSRRPHSSESGEQQPQPAKKKGLGLKEMEQIMSKMHKQNFDLKLELFHRREKQTVLEGKLEQLAADKEQLLAQNKEFAAENLRQSQFNEVLVQEVDKRDKAVQEAVGMIVALESEKDELTKQLSILRELAGTLLSAELDPSLASTTPRNLSAANLAPPPMTKHDARTISRMPSFVSQASHRTENLRDVWLSTHAADPPPRLPHVRTLSGVSKIETEPVGGATSSEVDHLQGTRLGSPSLSDLSESSFLSVYGLRHDEEDPGLDEDAAESSARAAARQAPGPLKTLGLDAPKPRIVTPTRLGRLPPAGELDQSNKSHQKRSQFTSITDILDQGPSSLATTYRQQPYPANSSGSDSDSARPQHYYQDQVPVPAASRSTDRAKEEKRDALRRAVGDIRLPNDQALPPTPDTISTSTLSGLKHSDDVLAAARAQQRSLGGGADGGVSLASTQRGMRMVPGSPLMAGDSGPRTAATYFDDGEVSIPPRPHSASESTMSQRDDGWEPGDEDASDAHSLESSLDIWLRESSKSADHRVHAPYIPEKNLGIGPPARMMTAPPIDRPSTSFGNMDHPSRRHGNHGRPVTAATHFQAHASGAWDSAGSMVTGEDLQLHSDDAIQAALFATGGPAPPPPGRRSSLAAKTGPRASTSLGMHRPPSTQPYRGSGRHVEFGTPSVRHAPLPSQEPRKQYPPVSGPARSRINNMFRRPSSATPASSSEVVPASPHARAPSPGGQWGTRDATTGSAPSFKGAGAPLPWGRRGSVGDDGATPPPIMRQRGMSTGSRGPDPAEVASHNGSTGSVTSASTISVTYKVPESSRARTPLSVATITSRGVGLSPPMPSPSQPNTPSNPSSSKKKWLPFGRSNSLRNRAG